MSDIVVLTDAKSGDKVAIVKCNVAKFYSNLLGQTVIIYTFPTDNRDYAERYCVVVRESFSVVVDAWNGDLR